MFRGDGEEDQKGQAVKEGGFVVLVYFKRESLRNSIKYVFQCDFKKVGL